MRVGADAISPVLPCPMPPGAAIFAAMSADQSYKRFFAELKRRKVFRVAAVYGAVVFVVLQAADILVPALALPQRFLAIMKRLNLEGRTPLRKGP